jgi:hypothetical protein
VDQATGRLNWAWGVVATSFGPLLAAAAPRHCSSPRLECLARFAPRIHKSLLLGASRINRRKAPDTRTPRIRLIRSCRQQYPVPRLRTREKRGGPLFAAQECLLCEIAGSTAVMAMVRRPWDMNGWQSRPASGPGIPSATVWAWRFGIPRERRYRLVVLRRLPIHLADEARISTRRDRRKYRSDRSLVRLLEALPSRQAL